MIEDLIMGRVILLICISFTAICAAQNSGTVQQKFEQSRPSAPDVPAPPVMLHPAAYPGGNKTFVTKVKENISFDHKVVPKYKATLILKISPEGEVQNISVYAPDEALNNTIKKAAHQVTDHIRWEPARNKAGIPVVDVVRLPISL